MEHGHLPTTFAASAPAAPCLHPHIRPLSLRIQPCLALPTHLLAQLFTQVLVLPIHQLLGDVAVQALRERALAPHIEADLVKLLVLQLHVQGRAGNGWQQGEWEAGLWLQGRPRVCSPARRTSTCAGHIAAQISGNPKHSHMHSEGRPLPALTRSLRCCGASITVISWAKVPPRAAWMARGRCCPRRCSSTLSCRRVKNSYASWCSLQKHQKECYAPGVRRQEWERSHSQCQQRQAGPKEANDMPQQWCACEARHCRERAVPLA